MISSKYWCMFLLILNIMCFNQLSPKLPGEQLSLTSIQKNYNLIKCWISQFTNLNLPNETKTTLPSNKRNFLESFWTSKLQPNNVLFYFRFVACATILLIFRGELAENTVRNMNHPHIRPYKRPRVKKFNLSIILRNRR